METPYFVIYINFNYIILKRTIQSTNRKFRRKKQFENVPPSSLDTPFPYTICIVKGNAFDLL